MKFDIEITLKDGNTVTHNNCENYEFNEDYIIIYKAGDLFKDTVVFNKDYVIAFSVDKVKE